METVAEKTKSNETEHMKNIDANNPKAITVFSREAHLRYRSSGLHSKKSDQSEHQEFFGKKGTHTKHHSTLADYPNE